MFVVNTYNCDDGRDRHYVEFHGTFIEEFPTYEAAGMAARSMNTLLAALVDAYPMPVEQRDETQHRNLMHALLARK